MSTKTRQYITAWWIFYKTDLLIRHDPEPDELMEWIAEVASDPIGCDRKLQAEFDEYIPQAVGEHTE